MLNRMFPILVGLLLVVSVACDDDDEPTGGTNPTFTATLSGANEVPAVQTNATGTATFVVQGATVDYTIVVSDIENANAAHIHTGEAGVNGPVLVPLFAGSTSEDGTLVDDSFDAGDIQDPDISFDELVDRLADGSLYVNVHTDQNPAGEIRGQIE